MADDDGILRNCNIETATLIAKRSHSHKYNYGDFKYCHEALYQASEGHCFVVGEGGAMTGYGDHHDDGAIGYGRCTQLVSGTDYFGKEELPA